jgi:antitoxin VapB
MATTAKLFENGRSQAVRLPKEFRFEGNEVRISKAGDKVILEPMPKSSWPEGFWKIFKKDDEFQIPEPLSGRPVNLD